MSQDSQKKERKKEKEMKEEEDDGGGCDPRPVKNASGNIRPIC